uniref:Uncharacterized protein n=1 Tax=Plectus sambesii TaxID=2011161 RepID=A0A914WTH6_9BILA
MGEEISLLLAHLIILFARTPTIVDAAAFCDEKASGNPLKLGEDQCRFVAIILHYLFLVHFGFLFLEALNNYCVNTYVANGAPLYGRAKSILFGLGFPMIPVAMTAITHFNTYTSDHTCWCNMDQVNFIGEIVPAAMLCVPALVMNEAAGMGLFPVHPDSIKEKRSSAYGCSRGAMFVIPLSFIAWIVGMAAVHNTNLSLYSLCSTLNLILGIIIIIAHTLGNDRARHLLTKLFCCCNCKKTKEKKEKQEKKKQILPSKSNSVAPNEKVSQPGENCESGQVDEIDLDKMIRSSIAPLDAKKVDNVAKRSDGGNREEEIDIDTLIRDSISRI